jgi:ATP-dependent DNA ligase
VFPPALTASQGGGPRLPRKGGGGQWLHEIKHDGFRIMRIILLENYPKNCCQFRDVA